ncbi:MAG: hypothetical protein PVI91_01275 [Gammaproteobacteria bacterium]
MDIQTVPRGLTYLLLAAGCLLAFVSALVPFFDDGHRLLVGVLLAGLLPYLIFGLVLPYLHGWALALPALVMVGIHAWVVVTQRFAAYQDYSDGTIYYVPFALAIAAAVLVAWALRRSPCGPGA